MCTNYFVFFLQSAPTGVRTFVVGEKTLFLVLLFLVGGARPVGCNLFVQGNLYLSRFTRPVSTRSSTWAPDVLSLPRFGAPSEGRSSYIHEAEERTKKKFLEISVGFEISKN